MEPRKENIVMFPFMAQGHIIPFLTLAIEIEQKRGCTITFVSTPLNIKRIKSSLPPNSSIQLLEIPFRSSDHGLPPDCESTHDLPYHLILKLVEASRSLKPSFHKLVYDLVRKQHGRLPLCIISDIFFGWCADISHEFGVFHAIFLPSCAFSSACYYSIGMSLPHRNNESKEFVLADFPQASRIHVTQMSENLQGADGKESLSQTLRKLVQDCMSIDGALVNSMAELDEAGLTFFQKTFGKPFWPIGPVLLPPGTGSRAGNEAAVTAAKVCRNWLDTKPPNSVLYVSFGSQNTVSASQMMHLALALEASGKNFIWVVRPPTGFDINSEFNGKECLPEGFEDRNKASRRGLLVHQWAPQMEILSHKSTSAFLSHCGWNSVLEALSYGVPIIGWPMAAEQFYNVKLLEEEIGVCLEVARGRISEVKSEDIVAKIDLVMNDSEKGKEMRKKACEVRNIINNSIADKEVFKGVSARAMDDFLNAAMLMREQAKRIPGNSISTQNGS
ncbi:UDP-glycosyltransferase 92A1 [Populus alba]|uniref:Glycosyltransferase n=2 Tax=Populus TaxID=3689 RepID=A0A4U5Q2Q7_POPAL|nr:UDP-glycosyltransferase 92A1-like [Populus alba]KAJ7009592.1 UDP-glycosyltransferase 92A1-like [Populus alba x Populus x berolinensis]TKS03812.1 hypothetical protein D5086_0000149580 [Populus alba]